MSQYQHCSKTINFPPSAFKCAWAIRIYWTWYASHRGKESTRNDRGAPTQKVAEPHIRITRSHLGISKWVLKPWFWEWMAFNMTNLLGFVFCFVLKWHRAVKKLQFWPKMICTSKKLCIALIYLLVLIVFRALFVWITI